MRLEYAGRGSSRNSEQGARAASIREQAKSTLDVMAIKAKGFVNFEGCHHGKGDAVDEIVVLVTVMRKQPPGFLSHLRGRLFDSNRGTGAYSMSEGDSDLLAEPFSEERHRVRKYEIRRQQCGAAACDETSGPTMCRITAVRKRVEGARVREDESNLFHRTGSLRSFPPRRSHRPCRCRLEECPERGRCWTLRGMHPEFHESLQQATCFHLSPGIEAARTGSVRDIFVFGANRHPLHRIYIVMYRCQWRSLSNGFSVTIACQARATRSVGNQAVGEFGAPVAPTG